MNVHERRRGKGETQRKKMHFTLFNSKRSIEIFKLMENNKTKKRFDYTIVWNRNRKKKTIRNTVINGNKYLSS